MTDILWEPIMKNQNLTKYLTNYDNTLFIKWKEHIIKNKYTKETITNNLKLVLPNHIIVNKLKISEETIDDKFEYYSKLLD